MGLFKRQNYKATKFKGDYIFSRFDYGMYSLETPRGLGEQLTSLAITGGRNCWTERGALVNQYGSELRGRLEELDLPVAIACNNDKSSNMFIFDVNNNVYYYDSFENLKRYITQLNSIPILTASAGKDVYLWDGADFYLFGDCYNQETDTATFESIVDREGFCNNGLFTVGITEDQFSKLWLDKQLVYTTDNTTYTNTEVVSLIKNSANSIYPYNLIIRCNEADNTHLTLDIGEKTLQKLNYLLPEDIQDQDLYSEFVWIPEDTSITGEFATQLIVPKLMQVASNRMWVVDERGIIFYSATGTLSDFREASGAGYIYNFYKDTSTVLSIEDYGSGILITKKNGMYWAKFSSSSTDSFEDGITVEKVNNITQAYAGDHIIIGSEVFAYDASSGNFMQAAYINYFGVPQEGSVLLHGTELNSWQLGIQSSPRRQLAYCYSEEVLILYYGTNLNYGLVITRGLSIFPRENTLDFIDMSTLSRNIVGVTTDGKVVKDFSVGTVIEDITAVAEFEALGLRTNQMTCGSIIEFSELNGIRYTITTSNAGVAIQDVTPVLTNSEVQLPNLLYSDYSKQVLQSSYAETSKWAAKKAFVTRMAAPLSGRDGMVLTIEVEPNVSFCFTAIRYPDMSQGE